MTKLLTLLASAAFVAVSAGAAVAQDDNIAVIDQIGSDNSGLITQLGVRNQAGSDLDPILQDGFFNQLTIDQTGEDNQIGLEGAGVDQIGDTASTAIFNEIEIDQNSNSNVVGEIRQAAQGTAPTGANFLSVTQGENGVGDRNRITKIVQEQLDGMPGQIAILSQTGDDNTIVRVEQRSETTAQFQENIINARFTGNFNGRGDLTGASLLSRATDNELIQRIGYDNLGANGNQMDLLVGGDFNRFGIFQGGRLNSVGFVTISGNANQVGLRQDGLENDIFLSDILGDDNNIGVGQIGTNRASVDLVGLSSNNEILGLQEGTNDLGIFVEGDSNFIAVDQGFSSGMGGDNEADFKVIGNSNFFDLIQRGQNIALFDVEGDSNNFGTSDFSGDAVLGLDPSTFLQEGMDNTVDVTIVGNQNLIAASQIGDGNAITADVTGNLNEAAFVQAGNLNIAFLNQSGTGNVAGFSQ